MASVLPLRIVEAIGLLHRLGYAGLRMLPEFNASDTVWQIIIFNVEEWDPEDEYGDPHSATESCVYSTACENIFNNGVQFPADVSHIDVAEAILDAIPSLQRSPLSHNGNREYVNWYRQLQSQIKTMQDLPVAHADDFDNSEGWELGWGTKHIFPKPPVLAKKEKPLSGKADHRDEYYVLELCKKVLGQRMSHQATFEWLLGDPSLKSGKQKPLPVDGYWPDEEIVVEYHERQHSEEVPFFDSKITASGMSRGEQRKIYDARKAQELVKNGKKLVIIDYRDFGNGKTPKIVRNFPEDLKVVERLLRRALESTGPCVITNFGSPEQSK